MKNSVMDRLKSYFVEYFSDATKPIARNLFLIVVSILALDIFRSVRFAHRYVLSKLSMVSILLSSPVLSDSSICYLSVPLGYQIWDKKQTKVEIAAGMVMVRQAMDNIGPDRQVFLLCDSWYPKGCVAGLVDKYNNLDIICNARIDTVMYDLPPERTGKRARSKKYGVCLSPEDFKLESPKTGA